jgi:hypothetical protein
MAFLVRGPWGDLKLVATIAKFLLLRNPRKSETKSHIGGSNTFFLSENLNLISLFRIGRERWLGNKNRWVETVSAKYSSRKCLGSQFNKLPMTARKSPLGSVNTYIQGFLNKFPEGPGISENPLKQKTPPFLEQSEQNSPIKTSLSPRWKACLELMRSLAVWIALGKPKFCVWHSCC